MFGNTAPTTTGTLCRSSFVLVVVDLLQGGVSLRVFSEVVPDSVGGVFDEPLDIVTRVIVALEPVSHGA